MHNNICFTPCVSRKAKPRAVDQFEFNRANLFQFITSRMASSVEVLFTPAEYRLLRERDLSHTTCVVFDILRATSTIVTALAAGAEGVVPVCEIKEALAWRKGYPNALLAGERGGLRITDPTGYFDFGNSPREFTAARVQGKIIVTTTTNGTRALMACADAEEIIVGSFLNLRATTNYLTSKSRQNICLVCAGTGEAAALEDTLAAGAMCDLLKSAAPANHLQDSAAIARSTFLQSRNDLPDALRESSNARRLLGLPELQEDVGFCLRTDTLDLVAVCDANEIVRRLH
jgi:2-phosphosulfolactate phosphatase